MRKVYLLYALYVPVYFWFLFTIFEPYIDYTIYYRAVIRFFNGDPFYTGGFVYLPSFFFLSPLVLIGLVYFLFLFVCSIVSVLVLVKLAESRGVILFFAVVQFTVSFNGNLEVFTATLVLVSWLYRYHSYIPPFLLAFACLKLSVLLIVPLFLYAAKNRKFFLFLFSSSLIVLNFVFLLHPELFFEYLAYGSNFTSVFNIFIRTSLLYSVYYFLKNYKDIKLERLSYVAVSERREVGT